MLGGSKKTAPEDSAPKRVPVFTVTSLHRPYEALCTVFAGKVNTAAPVTVLQKLGQEGGCIPECDAVIGVVLVPVSMNGQLVHAYGTAIRYI